MISLLAQAEELIRRMNRSEKARVLQWVAADIGDTFPGIESDPDTCGGESRIVRTRVPVWLLVQARRSGMKESEILGAYPTLKAEDLTEAWGYYRCHADEIDQQITDNEVA